MKEKLVKKINIEMEKLGDSAEDMDTIGLVGTVFTDVGLYDDVVSEEEFLARLKDFVEYLKSDNEDDYELVKKFLGKCKIKF